MGEFQEVIRQAERLCETQRCNVCPLHGKCLIQDYLHHKILEFESIVMEWAKDHPEDNKID